MERLSIDQIIAIAPEVGAILRDARQEAHRREQVVALYARYKGLLTRWVGWDSPIKDLQGQKTYETTIKALCDALDF